MDLRQLEMLLAVLDSGGYKRAGEALHVSHSAIHRQIRILEQELNDRLLVRSGKLVRITETGRVVSTLARRIQQEIRSVQQQIRKVGSLDTGHLRIGTGTSILTFFLPPVLRRFRERYPGIDVRVTTNTADQVIHDIQSGKLDVGIAYAPMDMPSGDIIPGYELLYREEFVLVVGEAHPLARLKSISLAEAVRFPFILYPRESHVRRTLDRVIQASGLNPQIVMEVENEEAMEKMIAINMGVAFLSRQRALKDRVRQIRLKNVNLSCDVGLVFPNSDSVAPAIVEFARMCREAVPAKRALNSTAR